MSILFPTFLKCGEKPIDRAHLASESSFFLIVWLDCFQDTEQMRSAWKRRFFYVPPLPACASHRHLAVVSVAVGNE